MEPALSAGRGFFPLDEQLELDGSELTPHAQESLIRLASWVPFGPAADLLEGLLGVQVSKSSARRHTLAAGEAGMQEWEEQTATLLQSQPETVAAASHQVMSADGAMVPLVGGEWAEVKTLVLAEKTATQAGAAPVAHLSYCSRLADVQGFERATLLEVHRRGLERAEEVAAVTDGADWLQGFIDYHRADAVRILDFAHAAEYVAAIGEAVRAAGHFLPTWWLEEVLHRLKHEGPERVLVHLSRIAQRCSDPVGRKKLQYLFARRSQLLYPSYQAAGWPIGSGVVESANKLVVEARLKGAGMHWKREHVNPMLCLRNAVCNDRWDQSWQERIKQSQQRRQMKRTEHAQTRLEQVTCQFLRQILPLLLSKRDQQKAVPVATLCPSRPDTSPVPTKSGGRTEAQKRWGRRPVTVRGARIRAEFAKN